MVLHLDLSVLFGLADGLKDAIPRNPRGVRTQSLSLGMLKLCAWGALSGSLGWED